MVSARPAGLHGPTLSGDVGEFYSAARQALRTESGQSVSEEQIEHVLEAFGSLPAHPDVDPTIRRLTSAGLRVGLPHGRQPDTTARFLQQAGLDQHVEQVVTAQQVGTWKPAPAVYRFTAEVPTATFHPTGCGR